MSPTVWILGRTDELAALEAALRDDGVVVRRAPSTELEAVVLAVYDGRGLLLVDARGADGAAALVAHDSALVPLLAVAGPDLALPEGALRLVPDTPAVMAHHLREVLAQPSNLRRHPRIRVDLAVSIDGAPSRTRDVSLYGLWAEPAPTVAEGQSVAIRAALADGAEIHLDGRVIARRGEGAAIRCRPASDADLLLWIHLLLGGLADSPLHGATDPLGVLFAD